MYWAHSLKNLIRLHHLIYFMQLFLSCFLFGIWIMFVMTPKIPFPIYLKILVSQKLCIELGWSTTHCGSIEKPIHSLILSLGLRKQKIEYGICIRWLKNILHGCAADPVGYNPQGLHLFGYILPKNKPRRAQNSLIQGSLIINVWWIRPKSLDWSNLKFFFAPAKFF